jgi:hypothetical protein
MPSAPLTRPSRSLPALLIVCLGACAASSAGPGTSPGGRGGDEQAGSGGAAGGGTGGSTPQGMSGSGGSSGAGGSAGAPETPDAATTTPDSAELPGDSAVASADAPLPPGMRKVYLLVGDIHVTDQSRLQLLEILGSMKESHGIVAQVMDSRMAKASTLMDAALIIAGPNNNYCSDTPDPSLKTLPIPIMVSRDCKTTALGLGTILNTQEYITDLPVKITIEKTDHPLAAGLSGVVPVLETRCRLVRGSKLGPDAIKIARAPADAVPADADSWPIFAYEKGGMMVGGFRAPAKRIGFFWHRPSAVTAEGKKLFQAAVDWALRP